MLNKSKQQDRALPRIQSQKRVHTAFQKKQNTHNPLLEKKVPKSLTYHRLKQRAFSTTNTCRAVRYENTGIMYTKKISQLENQSGQLDRELRIVEEEIAMVKKNAMGGGKRVESGRQQGKSNFITEVTDQTSSKVTLGGSKNLNSQKVFQSQIKIAENKLQIMRKKVDEQTERNKKMRKEVDYVRKQINTLKQLNKNIQTSLAKTSQQYNHYNELSKTLDEQISSKNVLMHKTKIQNQHKKAEMIRQYNDILKCLERELDEDKDRDRSSKADPGQLYITETTIATDQKSGHNGPKFSHVSMRKTKANNIPTQISSIKSKLQKYQQQFSQIKSLTGTKTTEQVLQLYSNKYEQNFDLYNYVNQLYISLQEKEKENEELREQRDGLLKEQEEEIGRGSEVKGEEMGNMRASLEAIREDKRKYTVLCQEYEKFMEELKEVIGQFYRKVDMGGILGTVENLTQENIIKKLIQIRQRCRELDNKFDTEEQKPEYQGLEIDLTQMLQNVKKESIQETDSKNERIMNREDFIKARETFMKKKPTPRRPLSKR